VAAGLDLRRGLRHRFKMTIIPLSLPVPAPAPDVVSFDRRELGSILSVYGRFVAAGIWRDYGISTLRDRAVFSIFRRTAETPLFRIEKIPALRARQQLYALTGGDGQVLKRGATLASVLAPLERKLVRPLD
jgi:hypothetical protein